MPSSAILASSARTTCEHLVELGRQAADRDADQAGVDVLAGEGEDGVGQPALLADLLEQPARGAAAERGVEHAEREAARRRSGSARCTPSTTLTCSNWRVASATPGADAARASRPGGRATGSAVPVEEAVRARTPCAPGVRRSAWSTLPATATTMLLGAVVALVEAADLLAGHRLDRLGGAGDRPAERRVAPGLRGEEVVRDVVGVVVVHRDLVEDHVTLGLDVLGGDQRAR